MYYLFDVTDGLGGGSQLTRNVLFNMCRESSDHGIIIPANNRLIQVLVLILKIV